MRERHVATRVGLMGGEAVGAFARSAGGESRRAGLVTVLWTRGALMPVGGLPDIPVLHRDAVM